MVELGCGKKCMKYLLFVINFLFFILGAAAFGLGIWALVDKNKMNVLTKVGADTTEFNVVGLLESAAIVLLVGGAAILVIGFLGCCGAFKQSQCLLCLYGFLLVLILIIEIAAIVIAAVFKNKVEDELKGLLKRTINSTYEGRIDTSEEFSLGLDYAQVYFQCCGVDSYMDFHGAVKWNRTFPTAAGPQQMTIPPSCCKLKDVEKFYDNPASAELKVAECPVSTIESNKDKSCWESIYNYLKSRIAVVIGIASGVMVLEIICLVFACCIISELRKGE